MLACDSSQCVIRHFRNEHLNLVQIVAQFIYQFVGISCTVIYNSFNLQSYSVFGDKLLGLKCHYIGFHVDGNHFLSPRVYYVKSGLDDAIKATEFLKNA